VRSKVLRSLGLLSLRVVVGRMGYVWVGGVVEVGWFDMGRFEVVHRGS
jgi:hypothetical protein